MMTTTTTTAKRPAALLLRPVLVTRVKEEGRETTADDDGVQALPPAAPCASVLRLDGLVGYDRQAVMFRTMIAKGRWVQRTNRMGGMESKQPRLSFMVWRSYSYSGGTNEADVEVDPEVLRVVTELREEAERAILEATGREQRFNSALVQRYRGPEDCIFSHCDNEKEFSPGEAVNVAIVTLCLGQGVRVLRMSAGETPLHRLGRVVHDHVVGSSAPSGGRPAAAEVWRRRVEVKPRHKVCDVPLRPGQLLCLQGDTNHLRHEVPRMGKTDLRRATAGLRRPLVLGGGTTAADGDARDDDALARISVSFRTFRE